MPDPFRTLDDPEPPRGRPVPSESEAEYRKHANELKRAANVAGGMWMLDISSVRPNLWRRFWAWALIGARWEKVE